ncbi:hypothetical protein Leryth_025462 [Lithospermum erythrorhizon]|nr:hypothetical protein Leryth_025462 [Lithospermum erythrorhizon]
MANFLVMKRTSALTLQIPPTWISLLNNCISKHPFPLSSLWGSMTFIKYFITKYGLMSERIPRTLLILGNAKGAYCGIVSILIFKNPVSVTGMLGYSLTVRPWHPEARSNFSEEEYMVRFQLVPMRISSNTLFFAMKS